jgi:ribosomal protein S18 acetylase RimI-like enzyme
MHVRRASPSDLGLVVAVGRRCYADHFRDVWTRAGLAAYLDSQYEPSTIARDLAGATSARWDLAFDGADAIGFMKTIADRPVPDASGRRGLELEKIYLLASSVGHGHGAALIEHVVGIAEEAAQAWIWLDVLKSNERGVRFYERAGFARVGEIPFATDAREIGMWIMCRPRLQFRRRPSRR